MVEFLPSCRRRQLEVAHLGRAREARRAPRCRSSCTLRERSLVMESRALVPVPISRVDSTMSVASSIGGDQEDLGMPPPGELLGTVWSDYSAPLPLIMTVQQVLIRRLHLVD